ncbi:hypothetical protein HAV15_004795 [Penicillium sp. str. |nr:hypothetical protein HAV15_004795 [Penicillium sp. str. \
MFDLKARLLALSLVFTLVTAGSMGSSFGLGEVDVVFPRNDTFEPMPLMPIVFAVQNNAALEKLYPTLRYRVSLLHQPSNATFSSFTRLPIEDLPANQTTQFLYNGVANLVNIEDTWKFEWNLGWTNCSTSDNGTDYDNEHGSSDQNGFHRRGYEPHGSIIFTTSKEGRQPNLTTLTTGDDCGKAQALAFNVTQTLKVPSWFQSGDYLRSCALLASPAPTPRPCRASVVPEAASSISASLTRAECFAATPAVNCPAKTNGAATNSLGVQAAWWTTGLVWLLSDTFC